VARLWPVKPTLEGDNPAEAAEQYVADMRKQFDALDSYRRQIAQTYRVATVRRC